VSKEWVKPAAIRMTLIGKTIFPSRLQSKASHGCRRRIMGSRAITLRDGVRVPALRVPATAKTEERRDSAFLLHVQKNAARAFSAYRRWLKALQKIKRKGVIP